MKINLVNRRNLDRDIVMTLCVEAEKRASKFLLLHPSDYRIDGDVDELKKGIRSLEFEIETEECYITLAPFQMAVIDKKEKDLYVYIDPWFGLVRNALPKNFTKSDLEELIKL